MKENKMKRDGPLKNNQTTPTERQEIERRPIQRMKLLFDLIPPLTYFQP